MNPTQRRKSPHGTVPTLEYEIQAGHAGAENVAGIDEAGRGPLAGPVVAAAVILPLGMKLPEVNDSKMLNAETRERLYEEIISCSRAVGVGIISSLIVDEINIYQATRLAMKTAVENLPIVADYLLIDGPMKLDCPAPQLPLIKGDRRSVSIATASIIAKVTRDRIMWELHELYPQYGFASHKGYGTKAHREALLKHGPCPVHRVSFKGVVGAGTVPLFDADPTSCK